MCRSSAKLKKDKMPDGTSKNKQNIMVEDILNKISKNLLNRMSEDMSKNIKNQISENISNKTSKGLPDGIPNRI